MRFNGGKESRAAAARLDGGKAARDSRERRGEERKYVFWFLRAAAIVLCL